MTEMESNFYVITGGPGVGKTTLLNELGRNGYKIVSEEARRIIKEQVKIQGTALPWKDKDLYARLMFDESFKTYQNIKDENSSELVFFDRGILDTICYFNMEKISISEEMRLLTNEITYNEKVFILPPWKEIYENDLERKQSWDEAVFTFEKIKETYLYHGYSVIEVPKDTKENRLKFLVNEIG